MHTLKYLMLKIFVFSYFEIPYNSIESFQSEKMENILSFQELLIINASKTIQILQDSTAIQNSILSPEDTSFLMRMIKDNAQSYQEAISILEAKWKSEAHHEKYENLFTSLATPFWLLKSLNLYLKDLQDKDPLTFKVIQNLSLEDSGERFPDSHHPMTVLERKNRALANCVSVITHMEFYYAILTHPILKNSQCTAIKKAIKTAFYNDRKQLVKILKDEYLQDIQNGETPIEVESFISTTEPLVEILFSNL
jgi:hypothetical protein